MKKREKLKQFHHNTILETAKKLFSENGVQGTTMDDIAREADYSKSTLYVYFISKDEIFSYIVYENMLLLKETLASGIRGYEGVEEAFLGICQAHVELYQKQPLYFESMVGAVAEPESNGLEIDQKIVVLGEEINRVIIDFLTERMEMGQVRGDIDPLQTAFALWAGICGLITMTYNKKSYIDCMHVSRQEFLQYGFLTFLRSILP